MRSVLTTEQETDKYAATMETANATVENALFYNVSSTATTVPAGFTNDPNNKMASKLNGNINTGGNQRVGPSIILKVMTGDTISISTNSWYTGAVQPAATGVTSISNDLLPLLTAGIGGAGGGKGGTVPTSFSGPLLGPDIANMISTDSSTYSTLRPKAFLNWMVVGEDYVAATGSSNHVAAVQIPICNAGDTMKTIVGLNKLVVRRNGWIYIYVSNESNQDVYFDNLVINLTHGPLVEQKDYYAFGMENPALSTQAIKQNYNQNRYKYNGIEYDTAFGLDYYEAFYRDLDPQIGKWTTIDPKIDQQDESISPYSSMSNNPIRLKDPKGDDACCEFAMQFWQTTQETATGIMEGSGGVPNVVTDLAAAAVEVVGTVGTGFIAAVEFLTETPNAPVLAKPVSPPTSPPATVAQPPKAVNAVTAQTKAQVDAKAKEDYGKAGGAEHTSGARPSTAATHEGGQARRQQDRQGSKGMKNPPRVRPEGHKGPWPPKESAPASEKTAEPPPNNPSAQKQ